MSWRTKRKKNIPVWKKYDLSCVKTTDLIEEIKTETLYPVGSRMVFRFISRPEWYNRRYQVIREIWLRRGLTK